MRKLLTILFVLSACVLQAQSDTVISVRVGKISIVPTSTITTFIKGNYNFTVPSTFGDSSFVSISAYKKNGQLYRTIQSAVWMAAGNYTGFFDEIGNNFIDSLPMDSLDIKYLTNRCYYQWDGSIVGNTSSVHSGRTKLRAGSQPRQLVAAGNYLYAAGGYNESSDPHWKMPLADPTTKYYVGAEPQAYPQVTDFVCADSNNVYWGGFELANTTAFRTYVVATKINTDEDVVFTNGIPFTQPNAQFYPSAIGVNSNPNISTQAGRDRTLITGMAVQTNGNYLFIARGGYGNDSLTVTDKRTNHGEVVQTITSIASPTNMACDNSGHLWLVHENNTLLTKYNINSSTGAITTTGLTITLPIIGRVTVSPDGSELAVCDLNDQIVRFYNPTTGAQTRTLGTTGGYLTNSIVTDRKFYWRDTRNTYFNYVSYNPDGTFYVGDGMNYRIEHFAANLTYIDQIAFLTNAYIAQALQSTPSRFFVSFLEFEIDYSVPLTATTGWKLKRNWQAGWTSELNANEAWFGNITEMSNGRTYATSRGANGDVNVNNYYIIELVNNGIARNTGKIIGQREKIQTDGSIIYNPEGTYIGHHSYFYREPLTGFDGSNNPIWGAGVLIATTPLLTEYDPMGEYALYGNKLVTFKTGYTASATNSTQTDYHFGIFKVGGIDWFAKGAKGTSRFYTGPYPRPGYFDNGNNVIYPGGFITALGDNGFWTYHGENWQSTATNKFEHIDLPTGLVVGQFGALARDVFGEEAAANGSDGNVLFGTYVEANGQGYIYTNGESSGSHRWSIHGLNTIQIFNATFPTSSSVIPEQGTDLMEGFNWSMTTLPNNFHGWTRTPTADVGTAPTGNFINTLIGNRSYDKFKKPDALFSISQPSGTVTSFYRDLGNNVALSSWSLRAVINLQNYNISQAGYGQYTLFQVLDDAGNEIKRFDIHQNLTQGIDLISESRVDAVSGTTGLLHHFPFNTQDDINLYGILTRYNNTLEISCNAGLFTIKYGPYTATTTLLPSGANYHNPKYFRLLFVGSTEQVSNTVSIQELRFIPGVGL